MKKLTLKTETIRQLAVSALGAARGGRIATNVIGCPSVGCPYPSEDGTCGTCGSCNPCATITCDGQCTIA